MNKIDVQIGCTKGMHKIGVQMDVQNGCCAAQDSNADHERLMLFASVYALKITEKCEKVLGFRESNQCQGFFHRLFSGAVSVFYQFPPQRDLKANSIFHVCTI